MPKELKIGGKYRFNKPGINTDVRVGPGAASWKIDDRSECHDGEIVTLVSAYPVFPGKPNDSVVIEHRGGVRSSGWIIWFAFCFEPVEEASPIAIESVDQLEIGPSDEP